MRRILIILAAIIVVVGIGIAVYFLVFAPKGGSLTTSTNPFGNTDAGQVSGTTGPEGGANAGTIITPNFIKITDGPVSIGAVATDIMVAGTNVGTTSSSTPKTPDVDIHYIDRQSGNIYSYTAHAHVLSRISNKTLPSIQEASWTPNGSLAFVRFLTKDASGGEHINTYALPQNGEGGYFLEQDLAEVRVSSTTLFSLLANTNGSVGTISKPDGSGVKTLFTSLLSSLIVYPAGGVYFAHTKASALLDGYAFQISGGGQFSRIIGPLRGLTVLPSPNGKSLLYSYVDGGAEHLAVVDLVSHTATALPLATLTEKCTWSDSVTVYCGVPVSISGSMLPDDWYQGAVSFSDRIWRIDMNGRVATLIVDPTQVAKTPIDAVALTTDPKQDVLIFTDRKTGSLWMYDL